MLSLATVSALGGVAYGWGRNSTFSSPSRVRKGIARRNSDKMGVLASNCVSFGWYDSFLKTGGFFVHLSSKVEQSFQLTVRRNKTGAVIHDFTP